MGFADALKTFFQGLSGGGQPQSQQPPQQGQQGPPQGPPPQPPSGIMGALSNPLVQGAVSSYLTAIGTPKYEGWGGALSRGGLAGLGAFNQARQQQLMTPYRQAQIQNLIGHGQLQTAQTGLATAKTDQISGILMANKHTAQVLRAMPDLDSEQQQRAEILASTIENDTSKVYDPKEVATTLFLQPAQEKKISADTTRSEAETAAIPKKLAVEEGKAADDRSFHTGELAARNRAIDESASRARIGPKAEAPDIIASRGIENLSRVRKEFEASLGPLARHIYGANDLANYVVAKGLNPANGQPLPPLPEKGWKYAYQDGEVKAIHPLGATYHWEE